MKKALKVILIVLIVLAIIVGAAAIWQWKNISGIYMGVTKSTDEIKSQREENQTALADEVGSILDTPLRELTEEEQAEIESGKLQPSDVYSKIFEEKHTEITQSQKSDNKKPTKDEIVTKYMSQLYALQSEFTARAEATISQGAAYYENLKKTQDKTTARANTITHFTPIVRGVEAECDAKVNQVVENLTKELRAIGENTDIVGTIKTTYANEKQLKLAYYANKYLK